MKRDEFDSLIVRDVGPGDFEDWLPLWEGYNSFYKRVIPPEVTQTTWHRFHDPAEAMSALVAVAEGRILGFVHALFHRNTAMVANTCYLQDLFTRETARNRGVGRHLIEAVYARAKAQGAPRVYWLTHESNTVAMKLYDKVATNTGFFVYRKLF